MGGADGRCQGHGDRFRRRRRGQETLVTTRVSNAAAADLVGCCANTIEQQIEEMRDRRPRRCDRGLTSTWSMPGEGTGSAQGALRLGVHWS